MGHGTIRIDAWLIISGIMFGSALRAFADAPLTSHPEPLTPPLEAFAKLPDDQLDVAKAALYIAQGVRPAVDVDHYLAQLDSMSATLKKGLDAATGTEAKLDAMADVIYRDWGFARSDVVPPDVFVGFDEVLDQKQWNCFGLTILYVVLGERVGMPLRMVAGTGHAFAEYAGTPVRYVETTERGRVYPSKDYLSTYLPFPCVHPDAYITLDRRQTVSALLSQTALAMQHQGRGPLAHEEFTQALLFDPKNAEALSGLGFLALSEGHVSQAIAEFQRAIEADPRFRESYGGLGSALYQQGDLPGAAQAYRKVLDLCPDEPKAVFNLAQIVYDQGNLDEAIALFRKYTALAPDDPDGYARLAFPLEDRGDLEGALAAYAHALRIDPHYTDAYVNMGIIRQKQGELDAARTAFKTALGQQPDNALALAGLARVLDAQGHTQEALETIAHAAQVAPGNAAVWLDSGAILRDTGDIQKAVESYQRAALLLPDDPEAFKALAEIYLDRGDTDAAKSAAQRASDLGANLSPTLQTLLRPSRQE